MEVIKVRAIHEEILRVLKEKCATYALPITSQEIGKEINVSPPYVRDKTRDLNRIGLVNVRRGPGGGYYLSR